MKGRVALVTGVSRRAGIGFAIARRFAAAGVRVFAHHHVPHDRERAWGADDIDAVVSEIGKEVADAGFDLAAAGAPEELFARARKRRSVTSTSSSATTPRAGRTAASAR